MLQQPPWLAEAWRELGQREVAGNADNPRIMALYRDAGAAGIAHDETAWCAAFVGACLRRSGQTGTGSLMARSYLSWGEAMPAGEPAPIGAVAVLARGPDPASGHVGFLVGETADHLMLLGGNQSDGVTVSAFARTQVLGLRWPAPLRSRAEPALQPEATSSDGRFEAALAHVLEMEGGWTDDPADPGGPTNLGLTLADLAAWRAVPVDAARAALLDELRRLDVAAVRPIYRKRYWDACRADALPPGLALMHFDCAVNQGLARAARFLQGAVGASVDGEIGQLTLAAAATADQASALATYAAQRRAHYRGLPTFGRFGRGWLARVERTLARSLAASNTATSNSKDATPMSNATAGPVPSAAAPVPTEAPASSDAKWWGQSMTVWGAIITATVAPALGPLFGLDISADTIRNLGGQAAETVRAIAGLAGTLMTLFGRARAVQPLVRRDFSLRL